MTSIGAPPRGAYRDRIISAGGRVEDRGWCDNLIVDRCRFLIASFLRGDRSRGIQRLLIGRGLPEWDTSPPDPAPRSTEWLVDTRPFRVRLAPEQIDYLDATGAPSTGPTNRLEVKVELGEDEPPGEDSYPMREFGLFGQCVGEIYMINYVRHPVIHKPRTARLERTIRLMF